MEQKRNLTRDKLNLFISIHTRFSISDLSSQGNIAIEKILEYMERDKALHSDIREKAEEALRRKNEWQ